MPGDQTAPAEQAVPPLTAEGAGSFPGAEPPERLVGYYADMVLIRKFELSADQMYKRAKIGGYCHLNLGEEATVVGLMAALRPSDYLFT
ncbi:MAG TPA: thiamine pyrophosphate-dependent enzyme, partial [Micrococcaceae bacterium]